MTQQSFAASTTPLKKWGDLVLVVVELNENLKPVDKKEFSLEKPFNANNGIFKIEFSNLFDDNSSEKKLNIESDNASILQRFSNFDQSLNWATQIKIINGKTYYFIINQITK